MRLILTSFILLFFSVSSLAQIAQDWEFDNTEAYNYYPTTNIIRAGDFTYVCSQSIDVLKTAYIFRLDSNGNSVGQDSIQHFDYSILRNKRMVNDASGNIYIIGNTLDSLQYSKIRLIKYDSLLSMQWDVVYDTIPNDYDAYSLLYSKIDDKLLIVGSEYDGNQYPIVLKFDLDGNLLWKMKDTTHVAFYINTYVVDKSGNLFLGGNGFIPGGAEDLVVSKIDSSGFNSWYANVDGSNHSDDGVMDLCVNAFNEICVSGRFEDTIPHKVLKFDQSGNVIWSSGISDISLEKIASDASGNIYVVGFDSNFDHEYVIYKYDSAGTFLDSAFSDLPVYKAHNVDYWVSVQVDNSGNVYLLNQVDTNSESRWFVTKLNSSLDTLWTLIYPDNVPNPSTASTLVPITRGFVVAGAVNNFGQLRVLQYHETITTGIVDDNSNQHFKFWPNPSSNIINYEFEESIKGSINYKLFDINSRVVFEKEIEINGAGNFLIDLPSFPSGIYHFRMQTADKIYNGKLIVVD